MKRVTSVYFDNDETTLCGVVFENGERRGITADRLDLEIPLDTDMLEGGNIHLEDDLCVITLSAEEGQWGCTVVWDYQTDKIVHLEDTPGAVRSTICGDRLITMYLCASWGNPADFSYAISPLEMVSSNYRAQRIKLELSPDSIQDPFSDCGIECDGDCVVFTAGEQSISVEIS